MNDNQKFNIAPIRKWTLFRELAIIAAVFLLLIPFLAIYRVTDFMIFCIFAMSFNLLYGYMGRLSFGQILYLGIGVYCSTLFSLHINPNPILSMGAGIIGGACAAGVLGLLVARLSDAAFTLTNLAFNQAGFFIVGSVLRDLTHGEDGLSCGVEPWGVLDFANEKAAFIFVLGCLIFTFFSLKILTMSPYGTLIRSIRENEQRVRFLGYNTFFYKWLTFVIAGTFSALAGTLYTLYVGFVSPVFIHPLGNVEVIFAALIGGGGSLYGALAGGVFFMALKDVLSSHVNQWEWLLGILLLGIVFYLRSGLTGLAEYIRNYIRHKKKEQTRGDGA